MLYLFLAGQSLFPSDRDDDLLSGNSMRVIEEWNKDVLEAKLALVKVSYSLRVPEFYKF